MEYKLIVVIILFIAIEILYNFDNFYRFVKRKYISKKLDTLIIILMIILVIIMIIIGGYV